MRRVFICLQLLCTLAFSPVAASASPMTTTIGGASATLTLDPDPPTSGTAHAVLVLAGAPPATLRATTIAFSSAMPSMNMRGASGSARMSGNGRYAFDLPLGMAAPWTVTVRASGGIVGSATFRFAVTGDAGSSGGMAGMASSSAGDPGPWRSATFLLLTLVLIGAIIVRRDRRSTTIAALVLGAVAIAGVAALQVRAAAQPGSMNGMDMNAMNDVPGDGPIPVRTVSVRAPGDAPSASIFAPGTLAPYLVEDVVTRAPGLLRDFNAYAGDHVHTGQVIARLDEPELAARAASSAADAQAQHAAAVAAEIEAMHHAPAAVRLAQADIAAKAEAARAAAAELARDRSLLHEEAISQREEDEARAQSVAATAELTAARVRLDDARANLEMAQAQERSARAQAARAGSAALVDAVSAGYTSVVAPSDGIVQKRLVDPGTTVTAGTAIARIAVVDRLRIQADVAQGELAGIDVGTPVSARLDDGRLLRGRVTSVAPVADSATRTVSVEAIVENPGREVVPGGYVRVEFIAHPSHAPGGIRIPSAAIIGGGDAAVWVVVNGTAHRVPVDVRQDDGVNAVVSGALASSAHVVVEGASGLEEGQAVTEQPA